jgi:hypothetical protein
MKHIALAAIVAGLMSAAPAQATLFTFTLTGPDSISFEIDSSAAPDFYFTDPSAESAYYFGRQIVFNGTPQTVSTISIRDTDAFRQLQITDGLTALVALNGPALFSGTGNAPHFNPGTYSFTDAVSSQIYSVTITEPTAAVPEPASWALMIAGFGLAGGAMRARRSGIAFA